MANLTEDSKVHEILNGLGELEVPQSLVPVHGERVVLELIDSLGSTIKKILFVIDAQSGKRARALAVHS